MPPTHNNDQLCAKVAASGLVISALSCLLISQLGYRFNSTPSLPQGIWKVGALDGPVQREEIVSICPPNTGLFRLTLSRHYLSWGLNSGGCAPLLKPVAAVGGDQVVVSCQGITVNGVLLPNSKASTKDTLGRPLIPIRNGTYAVLPGTVWLVSNCTQGFDSRYFGALPSANILGTARPIWVGGSIQ